MAGLLSVVRKRLFAVNLSDCSLGSFFAGAQDSCPPQVRTVEQSWRYPTSRIPQYDEFAKLGSGRAGPLRRPVAFFRKG